MEIKDILRNKRISSKRVPCERVYAATEQICKEGKVLVTTIQRVNSKMLYTAFCYNLYHFMTWKIKEVFLRIAEAIFKIKEEWPKKSGQIKKLARKIWKGFPRRKNLEVNRNLRQHIKWNQITKKWN